MYRIFWLNICTHVYMYLYCAYVYTHMKHYKRIHKIALVKQNWELRKELWVFFDRFFQTFCFNFSTFLNQLNQNGSKLVFWTLSACFVLQITNWGNEYHSNSEIYFMLRRRQAACCLSEKLFLSLLVQDQLPFLRGMSENGICSSGLGNVQTEHHFYTKTSTSKHSKV